MKMWRAERVILIYDRERICSSIGNCSARSYRALDQGGTQIGWEDALHAQSGAKKN